MQNGHIRKRGLWWYLKYRETVVQDGREVRRDIWKKLHLVDDQHRTEGSVRELASEILAPVNAGAAPESVDTVASFLEDIYLPHCNKTLKPSTARGYRHQMNAVRKHLGDLKLREARTPDIARIIEAMASEQTRARNSLKRARNFLCGGFRHAQETGAIATNPCTGYRLPKGVGEAAEETYAYSLEEIQSMLKVLDEPARTAVLVAALTGLRRSELQGLQWEDFEGDELRVGRSVWNGKESGTKTAGSKAGVPLLDIVRQALDKHKSRNGYNKWVFHGETGQSLRFDNLTKRTIIPALKAAGLRWEGWHAFRRGLATNLYALGAPDKTVQAILRHANVATTMAYYIKPVAAASHEAMAKLDAAFTAAKKTKTA